MLYAVIRICVGISEAQDEHTFVSPPLAVFNRREDALRLLKRLGEAFDVRTPSATESFDIIGFDEKVRSVDEAFARISKDIRRQNRISDALEAIEGRGRYNEEDERVHQDLLDEYEALIQKIG